MLLLDDSFNKTAEVHFLKGGSFSKCCTRHSRRMLCFLGSCSISQLLVVKRIKQLKCSENVTNTTQKNLSQVNRTGKNIKMLLEKIRKVSWCRELSEMCFNKRLGQHDQCETCWILARKNKATSESWG